MLFRSEGLHEASVAYVGLEGPDPVIDVETDTLHAIKVYVTVPAAARGKLASDNVPFRFVVMDLASGERTTRDTSFRSPHP